MDRTKWYTCICKHSHRYIVPFICHLCAQLHLPLSACGLGTNHGFTLMPPVLALQLRVHFYFSIFSSLYIPPLPARHRLSIATDASFFDQLPSVPSASLLWLPLLVETFPALHGNPSASIRDSMLCSPHCAYLLFYIVVFLLW